MYPVTPSVLNPISNATRQIRSNWTTKERTFRRRLAQHRTRKILELIQKSTPSLN